MEGMGRIGINSMIAIFGRLRNLDGIAEVVHIYCFMRGWMENFSLRTSLKIFAKLYKKN